MTQNITGPREVKFGTTAEANAYVDAKVTTHLSPETFQPIEDFSGRQFLLQLGTLSPLDRGEFIRLNELCHRTINGYEASYGRFSVTVGMDEDDKRFYPNDYTLGYVTLSHDLHFDNPTYNNSLMRFYKEVVIGPNSRRELTFVEIIVARGLKS